MIPDAPEELTLETWGLRLAGLAWGPPTGRPLLALHGWLDNANSFYNLAPLLPWARVVALDFPGHGRSEHRGSSAVYHFIDWVPDVVAAADALGWQRFVLLGHSMGAGVAALLAGSCPDMVEALIMVEGLGPYTSPAVDAPSRLATSIAERRRRAAAVARVPGSRRTREEVVALLCRSVAGLSQDGARILAERGLRELPEGGVAWRSDRRLRATSPLRLSEDQVHAFLARIAAPSLLLRATAGMEAPEALYRRRVQAIANLRVEEVGGGHHVHLDNAHAVAAAIADFLGIAADGG